MAFINDVFTELSTPSKFEKDWRGYAGNQGTHTLIGIFLSLVVATISFSISGDYPYRWQIFAFIAVVYAAKELVLDGWNGTDTVEDFLFVVVYGAGGSLVVFKQVENFSNELTSDIFNCLPFLFAFSIHLLFGVFSRWRAARV